MKTRPASFQEHLKLTETAKSKMKGWSTSCTNQFLDYYLSNLKPQSSEETNVHYEHLLPSYLVWTQKIFLFLFKTVKYNRFKDEGYCKSIQNSIIVITKNYKQRRPGCHFKKWIHQLQLISGSMQFDEILLCHIYFL